MMPSVMELYPVTASLRFLRQRRHADRCLKVFQVFHPFDHPYAFDDITHMHLTKGVHVLSHISEHRVTAIEEVGTAGRKLGLLEEPEDLARGR
eukprot:6866205-Pyramimonas_sp.AAC.1